MTEWWAARPDE